MSLLKKFKEKHFRIKASTPPDLTKYLGRTVLIDGEIVTIKKIVGNVWKPTFYEINEEYLIGMLRFHSQMLGDTSITEEQFKAFEETDLHCEKKEPKKVIGQL